MSASSPPGAQLPLDFHRNQSARFESFFPGVNAEVVAALRGLAQSPAAQPVYLWGAVGSGKSHLLQALCEARMTATGAPVAYLPLREAAAHGAGLADGLASRPLVCVDDVDCIAGDRDWERALFGLYNAMRDRGQTLVVSAACAPRELRIELPDLRTRLGWGLVYQLKAMDDADKHALIIERSRTRGLVLAEEVVEYMLRRLPRDVGGLCAFIDRIDAASLSAQRHVTIPFVKSLLEAR
jgi:DnaA-homolog protein